KAGNTKSPFYLINADLDIAPPSTGGGDWRVQFRGEPARSDRPAFGSGSIQAQGRWRQNGNLELDLRLNKSEIADISTLINGEEMGVHGLISGRARLAGRLNALGLDGRLNIEDVHRWDQSVPKGEGWPLILSGRLNAPAQELELYARVAGRTPKNAKPILSAEYRVTGYLSQPHWGVLVNCDRFPLEPLMAFARHMGVPAPEQLHITGTLDGSVGYTGQGAIDGQLAFHDTALALPDSTPVQFEDARVVLTGGHGHLTPAIARTAQSDTARIEADYEFATQALDLDVSTETMSIASLHSQAALAGLPVLEQMQSGNWNGHLRYRVKPGIAGAWSGQVQLSDVDLPFAGFSAPVRLDSAQADIDGDAVSVQRIRAHVSGIAAQGDYRYDPGAARPHRFRLSIPELDAANLESVLMPILRRGNLISMALSLGRPPVPDWLREWHTEGTVQVGVLRIGGVAFQRVRSRLLWDSMHAVFPDIQARFQNGTVVSRVNVDLRERPPAYRVSARLLKVDWKDGKLDADTLTETSGMGRETLANLHSEGSFTARGVEIAPPDRFETVAGCYELTMAGGNPRARFTALQMVTGDGYYIGDGLMRPDGQLVLQVASGDKQLRLTGRLEGVGTLREAP
ncbi:MAG: hypothetical protein M3Y07_19195, partial [Acidobacteriota bacterium]|nr:hypothetical protein [Acidobacteriota bacterium]